MFDGVRYLLMPDELAAPDAAAPPNDGAPPAISEVVSVGVARDERPSAVTAGTENPIPVVPPAPAISLAQTLGKVNGERPSAPIGATLEPPKDEGAAPSMPPPNAPNASAPTIAP